MAKNFPEEKYIGSNNNSEDFTPNAYIQIRPNDIGRLWVTRTEMGQGVRTTLPMIPADELEIDWSQIQLEQASTVPRFRGFACGPAKAAVRTTLRPDEARRSSGLKKGARRLPKVLQPLDSARTSASTQTGRCGVRRTECRARMGSFHPCPPEPPAIRPTCRGSRAGCTGWNG